MSGHTPGPWKKEQTRSSVRVLPVCSWGAISVYGRVSARKQYLSGDACLIAAAPDLLEALRDLRAEHHCSACDSPHAPECPSVTWADRAIAKAEGR